MNNAVEPGNAGKGRTIAYQHITRVLCATDLSTRSEGAVQRALLFAQRSRARLSFLHIVDEDLPSRMIMLRAQQARNALRARQLASDAEITVAVGSPHRAIARLAADWDADLILLGRCRKRPDDPLLGATAERVIRGTRRAVLVVNNKPRGAYANVLFASDLSHASTGLVRMTQRLGLLEAARGSILHVYDPASRPSDTSVAAVIQAQRQSSARLVAQLQAAGLDPAHFEVVVKTGTPCNAISAVVADRKPQLLVLGTTRHPALKRLFGTSITHELLRRSECDVLIASPTAVAHVCEEDSQSSAPTNPLYDGTALGWPPCWW